MEDQSIPDSVTMASEADSDVPAAPRKPRATRAANAACDPEVRAAIRALVPLIRVQLSTMPSEHHDEAEAFLQAALKI